MKKISVLTILFFMCAFSFSQTPSGQLSQQLLQGVKLNENCVSILSEIENLSFEGLVNNLDSDNKKLSFWINIYNASAQLRLKNNPRLFKEKGKFYKEKSIILAGKEFSLDEIEHGILRRNSAKYSLGYFRKIITRKEIKKLMVKQIDPRIHFALNCGAKSCPPVLFYTAEKINAQLELATLGYLEQECEIKNGKIYVPALFSWFRGDFGGKKGTRHLLIKYAIIKSGEKPRIVYKAYDWTLSLENFK